MALGVGDIPLNARPGFMQGLMDVNTIRRAALENRIKQLEGQYYAPNIESEIAQRNALTQGQNITNKYLPERLQLANAFQQLQNKYYAPNIESQIGLSTAEANKINYMLQHPGLMGGDEAKNLQILSDMGLLNNKQMNNENFISSQTPTENSITQIPQMGPSQQSNIFDVSRPFNTGNQLVDSMLNRKYAQAAYQNKMTQAFNWTHLPVETRSQLIAQGYGMGIEPLKMVDYINKGMGLQQIAQQEGLDPENLPPPIYPPTATTKTRVQQVEQVGNELDYLSSATTPIIKRYADTFAGFSPARIKDMLSNNPEAQKRFGQYIGALSIQTGLATGRALLEGTNRPGVEIMREIKNSAIKGIDQHSPIKLTGIAFEAAQHTIDEILHKGAKIRTTTGMNPLSEINRNKNKVENKLKDPKNMTTEEIKQELASMRR